MTLEQFFNLLSNNPFYIIAFFVLIPITALVAGFMGKNEGHLSPWKYLYSALIYLVCVPGIFAVTLIIYSLFFERRSIFQTDIYTQVLPIISMVITLLLIRNNVDLNRVPGFGRISGLIMMIGAVLVVMWVLVKTHIIAIAWIRIEYILLMLIALLVIFRFGWSRLFGSSAIR